MRFKEHYDPFDKFIAMVRETDKGSGFKNLGDDDNSPFGDW